MKIQAAAKTDIGRFRRKNEDSYYADVKNGLFVVCDGMGGHSFGEVASQKAIEFVVKFFRKAWDQRIMPVPSDKDFLEIWSRLVAESIEFSCDELISFAMSNPELEGMATTITVVLIVENYAFVGYLGDSRLYIKRDGLVKQLTCDHTLFEDFVRSNPNNSRTNPTNLEKFRHILTRCAGRPRTFDVETLHFSLRDGDALLLCTDGLSNYFFDESVVSRLLSNNDPELVTMSLINYANTEGGRDNITAIVIQIEHNLKLD